MASKVMVAIAEENAVKRLQAAADALGERFGLAPFAWPENQRDPYTRANQLAYVADFLEAANRALLADPTTATIEVAAVNAAAPPAGRRRQKEPAT